MANLTRRRVLQTTVAAAAASWAGGWHHFAAHAYIPNETEVPPGERPPQDASVEMLHPRARVPLSFIIDDSTCLVNMGAYCMPQFRAVWPQNPAYWKKWQDWPREIPDSFVREFGEFCAQNGVRGKYSIVPYPACVGWLDRELPGWTRKELLDSLKLVRDLMVPNWDITPEMITHTRVIDLNTGRPTEELSPATMENSYPPQPRSADEMAAYIAYALRILKNAGIPCEAITTPGGFGNKCKAELSLGVRQAVSDVFAPEIPHYFKYIVEKNESSLPRLEHVEGLNTPTPKLVVNVPAATGDWLGGWEGDNPPQAEKYCNDDATAGRMVELIERGQPAVMFAHWAGFYSNGSKKGFEGIKRVILALNARFKDKTIWMKTSELARYQAARELTKVERTANKLTLTAPFAGPSFTMRVKDATNVPAVTFENKPLPLTEVTNLTDLKPNTWLKEKESAILCLDLPRGKVILDV
jgi:hypothetical protein